MPDKIISIRVDPTLYKKVRMAALKRGDTITGIVKKAFREYLEAKKKTENP